MSSTLKLSLVLAGAIALTACQSNPNGNFYGYNFDSARITYKISGSSEGSSTVIIKGDKKVIKNNIIQKNVDGTSVPSNSYLIQSGDRLYTLDAVSKTGSSIKNPLYAELTPLSVTDRQKRLTSEAISDYTKSDQEKSELKPEKQEEVAGQKCDVYKGTITTTCLWQGIPLRTIASLADYGIKTETIATKIEINPTLSDSEFDVPKDYQIKELN